jgi:hypothetical protein
MTSAVCDSGPLTHLWQAVQWQAFRTFDTIHVSRQVAGEVERHVPLAQMTALAGRDVIVNAVSDREIAATRRIATASYVLGVRGGPTLPYTPKGLFLMTGTSEIWGSSPCPRAFASPSVC